MSKIVADQNENAFKLLKEKESKVKKDAVFFKNYICNNQQNKSFQHKCCVRVRCSVEINFNKTYERSKNTLGR